MAICMWLVKAQPYMVYVYQCFIVPKSMQSAASRSVRWVI